MIDADIICIEILFQMQWNENKKMCCVYAGNKMN